MDNFELITYNITHISFCLFELLKDKYSPVEILAFAVRMDGDAYVKEESLDTSTIFEAVFDAYDSQTIDIDGDSFEFPNSIEGDLSFVDAIAKACIIAMCLFFPVDNEDMDSEELFGAVLSQEDRIKKMVSANLESIIDEDGLDVNIRKNVKYFIWFNGGWKTWNIKMEKLMRKYGEPEFDVVDIDDYVGSFDFDLREDEDFDAFVNAVERAFAKPNKKQRIRKSPFVFGILSIVAIAYGIILLVCANGLGVMPILIGVVFGVLAIILARK